MKVKCVVLAAIGLTLVPFAGASLLTTKEDKFVADAYMDSWLAVRLGNQVLVTSSSPKLQSIAQANVSAHTNLLIQLKTFAEANKVNLPTSLDQQHMNVWNRVSVLTGAEQAQSYLNFSAQANMQLSISYRFWGKHATSTQLKTFVLANQKTWVRLK